MMAKVEKELPKCKYGAQCYRKNQDHLLQFSHPSHDDSSFKDHARGLPGSRSADGAPSKDSCKPTKNGNFTTPQDDEDIDGAAEGEWELDDYDEKFVEKPDSDEVGHEVVQSSDAHQIAFRSPRHLDGVVLLLLVGVPGSGKSTFCANFMSNATQPWSRICQDIIAKGKRGTKKQCLRQAEYALSQRRSVVIDRCNIDKVQRLEFLQLAASLKVECHAVVLNLPASLCIQRASNRVAHEGGLHAGNAGPVINRVFRSRQLPSLGEGFTRITFCRTDSDVDNVVQEYRDLHVSEVLESGVFGAAISKGKNVLEPLQEKVGFQRKGNNPAHDQGQQSQRSNQQSALISLGVQKEQIKEATPLRTSESSYTVDMSGGDIQDMGANTLVFPSISTADFQFDHDMASTVVVEAVSEFLLKNKSARLRLVLIDLTSNSHMLSLVHKKATEGGVDSKKFSTYVGDITKLRSSGGPPCNIIANAANWRLKAGGGGVNAAIYRAAGPGLEEATKKVAATLKPGTSVVVHLPTSSPLCKQEGVTHVIHVLGPNMNPQRPNCLAGDYTEGCKVLRNAYSSLFQNFASVTDSRPSLENRSNPITSDVGNSSQKPKVNAFTVLMQAAKRKGEEQDKGLKREKVRVVEEAESGGIAQSHGSGQSKFQLEAGAETQNTREPENQNESEAKKHPGPRSRPNTHEDGGNRGGRRWDNWALALYKIALHPEQHQDTVLQVEHDAVVLPDLYPKAKKHVLIVVRKQSLDSLEDLRQEHVPLLESIHSLGLKWAASFIKEDSSLAFRLGYHSVPSMRKLHLHVISQDFESPHLKNKKHWNSFTTTFFRDSLDVLDELKRHGKVKDCGKDKEKMLQDVELRCHRCRSAQPNIPRLKSHISTCRRYLANGESCHLITMESLSDE